MGSHKDLFQKIEAIESLFNDGSIKAGQKLLKSLNLDLKSLPSVPNKLRHKHNFVLAQSRYFNDVSSFAVNPKRAEMIKELQFPHSLGLLYSAFTYYAGFKVNSGEYKLMGLAPYGDQKYSKIIKDNLIDI